MLHQHLYCLLKLTHPVEWPCNLSEPSIEVLSTLLQQRHSLLRLARLLEWPYKQNRTLQLYIGEHWTLSDAAAAPRLFQHEHPSCRETLPATPIIEGLPTLLGPRNGPLRRAPHSRVAFQ